MSLSIANGSFGSVKGTALTLGSLILRGGSGEGRKTGFDELADEGDGQGLVEGEMKAALGSRVRCKLCGETIEERAAEGQDAEVVLEGGVAEEGFGYAKAGMP